MASADEQQLQSLTKYRGNCHCGAFVYEFKAPEIKEVYECNCSICRKKGYLLAMPAEGTFEVVKGSEDALTTYKFGESKYDHKVRYVPSSTRQRQGIEPRKEHRSKRLADKRV